MLTLTPSQLALLPGPILVPVVMEEQPPADADEVFVWMRGNLPKDNCAPEGLYAERYGHWLKYIAPAPHAVGDIITVDGRSLRILSCTPKRAGDVTEEECERMGEKWAKHFTNRQGGLWDKWLWLYEVEPGHNWPEDIELGNPVGFC